MLVFVIDKRKRLIKSKPKVQLQHDTMLTATSMIIGTKSQSFPSPLSTSIDFDNLMATSSLCCLTIYHNLSSFRQFVWGNKLDFGWYQMQCGRMFSFCHGKDIKSEICNSVVKLSNKKKMKQFNMHALSVPTAVQRKKKFAHYLDENWKMFSLHDSGRIKPFFMMFYE